MLPAGYAERWCESSGEGLRQTNQVGCKSWLGYTGLPTFRSFFLGPEKSGHQAIEDL